MIGESIRVRGLVQGVGFRPTVWRIARDLGLRGSVINDGEGVLVNAWAESATLDAFCEQLRAQCPPLAHIEQIERSTQSTPAPTDPDFRIGQSAQNGSHTGIVPDAATCAACRAEVADRNDRRYRYPFTNCTHCGPRLSIVRRIPYDRVNTSMSVFLQCPACQAEYQDPADRRFHAQPNACPVCGPSVWLEDAAGQRQSPAEHRCQDAIELTARRLAEGKIVAIKGIGGFHLACNAADARAVQRLRERKKRYAKPFALMIASTADAERFVRLSAQETALLRSPAAPIVLGEWRQDAPPLADQLAPDQDRLGVMLPYTPLHHILFADWSRLHLGGPLVMTSGNRSDEPQCTDNSDAAERLDQIADYWLLHDREIVNRVDDSVVRVDAGIARPIRRARGFAPSPLSLPPGFESATPLLAMGGELKNTFCLLRDREAVLSQHLGDLEDARTSDAWEQSLALYRNLYQHSPQAIAVDLHPDYRSTRYGRQMAEQLDLPSIEVQHHHAHIASVMADNGWPLTRGPVLGVAMDGLGMGSDDTLWGGEFLLADYPDFERLAHLPATPLPGGTRALLEPWRNTWAHLQTHIGWDNILADWPDLEIVTWLQRQPLATFEQMITRQLNSPLSSSCGRLFDAVAGALDLCRERILYEGQAAIELEASARRAPDERKGYPLELQDRRLVLDGLWRELLNDLAAHLPSERIAARFHNGLAEGVSNVAKQLCADQNLDTVALSGGGFQNRTLFTRIEQDLSQAGLRVLSHRQVPNNDGGLALGQAAVAAAICLRK